MNANPSMNEAILQVEHLSMKFGGLVAIGDLSFVAKRGEITALIGPNGAGKTTVFNCITGFYKPSEGMITLNRNDGSSYLLERLPNHEIPARAKVARTFQNIRLFSGMTLLENLLVAQHNKLMKASGYTILGLFGFSGYRRASAESVDLAKHWLEKADLVDRADDPAGDLPYGAQRRLEIARAMCTGPELLCLDEPAAGLNPKESAALNELLIDIKDTSGASILLIEHDMSVVMQISDHVVVLEYGRKISDGSPQSVRTDPRVIAAYLGVDDEDVESVLTEVGDEDVIEQLDTGPDAAHGPGTSSSYLAGPVTDTVGHSSGERVTVAKGASKAGQVDAKSLAAADKAASLAAVPAAPRAPAAKAKPAPKAAPKAAAGTAVKSTAPTKRAAKVPSAKAPAAAAGGISNRLPAPRGGKADNLTRIKGIGSVNEKKLNDHGIFHFDQIGAWKKADVEAAEAYLAFDGRIAREEWVKQARLLSQGKDTEFSRRVDAGKVATSHASGKTAAKPVAGKRGGSK
ncbi:MULTISPECIES: ATP-binding cassette domain-containing protein [unclassified Mesorhizobium]|uniref:ATP-binding cassette domain-containing protein n=1 Tax=unclassified Mesorhizobium TaxID=325217 RepID=UPI0003CF2E3C|nr:ATP-binding cassette domain-containing protein [Mesorhizobium sp. LNHC252B00]ESY73985.1 branched-chain amino acid ABC transporter ATP-binding protein [Mesorhizobium sp. LNHC252B00]